MVASSMSATPKYESGALADFITGLNILTIGTSERFVISSDSSHHSSTNASGAEDDSIIRSAVVPPLMTEAVVTSHAVDISLVPVMGPKVTSPMNASLFQDFVSTKTVKADTTGPSYYVKQNLSMGSRELNFETLHQVFVLQWNVLNDSLLDDYDVSRAFVDHLAPPALFSQICKMDYYKLFTEFNRLESKCEKQVGLLKVRDAEIESLKAQLLLKETEAAEAVHLRDLELKGLNATLSSLRSQNDGLVDQVHALEATCSGLHIADMACHLEEKFYPHLLTTISGQRWILAHNLKLVLVKCLNSSEYLAALGAAISRAVKKGMQDGITTGIDHDREGRSLTDVAAYNPSAEADFNSAVQELREIDFPLLAELKSHKDANVEDIMNLLRLALLLMLLIRANIAVERSNLLDVWTPLSEPMFVQNLIGDAATVKFEKEDLDTTPERDLLR
nr:hypothetical protein [Tanacetum cinerariifolium]